MPDRSGGSTPERNEESVPPVNPPHAAAVPSRLVAGMWYFLAPIVLLVAVVLLSLFFRGNRDSSNDETVPTTGITDETTPGGVNPDPKPGTTQEEREFRGERG